MMKETQKEIADAVEILKKRLPKALHNELLLTGGAAAFLYGSDRPFSHDMDFMIPKKRISDFEKTLELKFERHTKKAVFHSLKGVFEVGSNSYDLIAESVIEPENKAFRCSICLTEEIIRRKTTLKIDKSTIYLIPRELLVLIKILAGRGLELGKYDLYDAQKILESFPDFDFVFFKKLACQFCSPQEKILPVLKKNTGKVGHLKLTEALKSLQRYG